MYILSSNILKALVAKNCFNYTEGLNKRSKQQVPKVQARTELLTNHNHLVSTTSML